MNIVFDGSVCFDTASACYKYYSQIVPRVQRKANAVLLPSPTGVLDTLSPGSTTNLANFRAPSWLPAGKIRTQLSEMKRWLTGKNLQRQLQGASAAPTLFQSFYFTLPPQQSWKAIAMVHDVMAEKYPSRFTGGHNELLKKQRRKCIDRAERILVCSDSTKQDVQELFGVPLEKIDRVYYGVDFDFFSKALHPEAEQEVLSRRAVHRPYLLQVGGRRHHKNFTTLLEAFSQSGLAKDYDLVCAGEPIEDDERQLIRQHGVESAVVSIVKPSEPELRMLYQKANVFVYPSLYEGFGFPPLEAMASGAPVAASNVSSIPETVADAGKLFDPQDPYEIAQAIEVLLDSSAARTYQKKGKERARAFSWDRTANETLAVYRKMQSDF